MKQIGYAQVCDLVGLALFVNEQGEVDCGFVPEDARIVAVAEADGREGSTFVQEGLLVFAQLRDVLAAKNSSIVAKKHDDGRLPLPQRSEANLLAESVGKNDGCEATAESFRHGR